jgi:hypothetical protein
VSMALRSAGGVYGLLPTVIGRICFESQVNKWFAYVYEGYAKRPSKQNAYSEGLWVDHVERYGRVSISYKGVQRGFIFVKSLHQSPYIGTFDCCEICGQMNS